MWWTNRTRLAQVPVVPSPGYRASRLKGSKQHRSERANAPVRVIRDVETNNRAGSTLNALGGEDKIWGWGEMHLVPTPHGRARTRC